jgi:hypothetical protein
MEIKFMEAASEGGLKSDLESKKQRVIKGVAKNQKIRVKTRY